MPTYEYECEKCGYRFEKLQSIKAKTLRKCPECKKMSLKRLIGTGAGIIFKGSGFYQTDYPSESYQKGKNSETKSSADKKDTGKKKDSKPKTESKTKKESKNKDSKA